MANPYAWDTGAVDDPAKQERDDLRARLAAAEARAEKAEGEVKYLRAHREWAAAAGQAASRLGSIVIPDWWLAANPEPQPPEGCET